MTQWQMYWLTRLDGIGEILSITYVIIIISFVIISILLLVRYLMNEFEKPDILWKLWRYLLIAFIINSLGYLIPTTKEMAAILIIPKIINNEKLQKLPDNLIDLTNQWIENLKPKQKGE